MRRFSRNDEGNVFKEKNEVINLSKFSSSEWVFTLQPSISQNSGASEGNIIQVVDFKISNI
jgi:hypothetical protein